MKGIVDASGRALMAVAIRLDSTSPPVDIDVWIDTGFTGEIVLPQYMVDALSLRQSGSVDAVLADGSQVELKTFTCFVDWFGKTRRLEIIANDGQFPLLGIGLLLGFVLRVNYDAMELSLDVPQDG